jgi:triosephosphate isomerase
MNVNDVLKPPIVGIGFKSYSEAIGVNALKLARLAKQASDEIGVSIFLLPQHTDIRLITQNVSIPVFATHIDPIEPGAGTGYILPEAVKEAGAVGFMINHVEHRTTLNHISLAIKRAKKIGLVSAVCTETPEESQAVTLLGADIIIAELPEYIGGEKAVSIYAKDFLANTIRLVKDIKPSTLVISGGSIKNYDEAKMAMELGLDGVGASRSVIKAQDPYKVICNIAKGAMDGWKNRKMGSLEDA